MGLLELMYKPKWYHLGDADEIHFALAYGALALGTIFLVEYISEGILFSKAGGILTSDAAAHIIFSNSNWLQVLSWIVLNRPEIKEDRRICKRAILALVLRFSVLVIDLIILGMSVPRSIDIYERDVGSSIMAFSSFRYEPVSLFRILNSPCRPDRVTYAGFKPTANRKICFSSVHAPKSFNSAALTPHIDFETTDVFVAGNFLVNQALAALHVNSEEVYTFSHIKIILSISYHHNRAFWSSFLTCS